jgi:ribonuclease R
MAAGDGRPGAGTGFVASIEKRGRFAVAVPLFERAGQVAFDRKERVQEGEIVWAERRGGRARLVRRLGDVSVARDVSEALAMERLGGRGFPARLEEEARASVSAGPDHSVPRTDLTRMPTFTVDPSTARDFDDAVSAERKGDSVRLLVHIADVASWVTPDSGLDREALRRGNSVYIPTSVEPMLPHELSSGECSLAPGEERLALTTEMLVSGSGEVEEVSFYRSRVRSDARLDYDQLDRIFAGSESPPGEVSEAIDLARGVAAVLADRRGRHRLEVGSAEPSFEFDGEGNVTRAFAYRETEAHRLIEHLMILVNEQVASLLERSSAPAIFRVHQQPDPDRIERLFGQLASLELPTPPMTEGAGPTEAGRLAVEASRTVAAEAARRGHGAVPWGSLVLRSLKPARYLEENLGHAGLGSEAYSHFTSPIRRYPDLFVHRSLLSITGGGESPPDRALAAEVALHCSETEREASLIERDADDICAAFLLERELFEGGWGREFEGEVSGLIGAGAFISFGGRLGDVYEGFVPVRRFGGERFALNEQETALVGSKTGRAVRFGDPVSVTVTRVQPTLGRVDLLFAGQ